MTDYYTISLKPSRHKRKIKTQMILTSNAVESEAKPVTVHPMGMWLLLLLVCILAGGFGGYLYYAQQIFADYQATIADQAEVIEELQAERKTLNEELFTLNDRVDILSASVNTKAAAEAELLQALESQSLPTEFPLSSSATLSAPSEEAEPILLFTASEGSVVVATANGRVAKVESDEEYGTNVWIDHGNGYVTIYRNKGEALVKEGDSVAGGNTIFFVGSDNTRLGYQMQYEGEYIEPMDMLAISG